MLYTARYPCKIVEEKLITHKLYLVNLLILLLGKLLCKVFAHVSSCESTVTHLPLTILPDSCTTESAYDESCDMY